MVNAYKHERMQTLPSESLETLFSKEEKILDKEGEGVGWCLPDNF